ncbi:MAG: signal recognition particle protein [Phycisphaeraceae bacterium]|jgi:signal recognition particle subunit SRP54|nr:signal recognition particle protein [Phycisphaeraceae bacterium]
MFENLTDKFSDAFRKLSGRGRISESNITEAMDDVRTALLEADVHYEVVDSFIAKVSQLAMGTQVLSSLKPAQLMIKIVNDELVDLMGPVDTHLMEVDPGPTIVMMCGLQGSGKTTTCGKLAAYLKKRGRNTMLCAADLQRPAAVQQLETLANQVKDLEGPGQVHFYAELDKVAEYGKAVGAAVTVCKNALKAAHDNDCQVLVLDTAGRLHVNDQLMNELRQVNAALNPHQIYLVIDAMTGQDAVNSAKAFNDQLELDGVILTKFDSDTRGGAALSVKQITGAPIKFMGVGEHLDALEEFHPERVASRILGMGDVVSLVEKAQQEVSAEDAQALQDKMAKGTMTMDDFLNQLRTIRRMGSMKNLMGMLPGIGNQLKDLDMDDAQLDQTEAIIKSMTQHERREPDMLDNSRRRRISRGSGTNQQEVSQLVKGFDLVAQMSKQMAGMGMMSRVKAMAGLGNMDMSALGTRKGTAPQLAPATAKGRKSKYKQRKKRSR